MTPKTKDDIIEGYESTRVNTDYERYEDMWDKESIKQMMEEYLRQSSCGMKWIKASERLPVVTPDEETIQRFIVDGRNSEGYGKVFLISLHDLKNLVYYDKNIKWLDESPESYCSLCMKVEDGLPDVSGYVLGYTTAGWDKIWYSKEKNYFGTNEQFKFLVTHWMPLPTPPIASDALK